jgi:hypothetical protein
MRRTIAYHSHYNRLRQDREDVLRAIDFEIAERDRIATRFGISAWVAAGAVGIMLWHFVDLALGPSSVNWRFVVSVVTGMTFILAGLLAGGLLWSRQSSEAFEVSRFERLSDRQKKLRPLVKFDLAVACILGLSNIICGVVYGAAIHYVAASLLVLALVIVVADHSLSVRSKHFVHFDDYGLRRPVGSMWWLILFSVLLRLGLGLALFRRALSGEFGRVDVQVAMLLVGIALVAIVMCVLHVSSDSRSDLIDQRRDLLIGDPIVEPRLALQEVVFGLSIDSVEANVFSRINECGIKIGEQKKILKQRAAALARAYPKCPGEKDAARDAVWYSAEEIERLVHELNVLTVSMRATIESAEADLKRVQQTTIDAGYFRAAIARHREWLQREEEEVRSFVVQFSRWRQGA